MLTSKKTAVVPQDKCASAPQLPLCFFLISIWFCRPGCTVPLTHAKNVTSPTIKTPNTNTAPTMKFEVLRE